MGETVFLIRLDNIRYAYPGGRIVLDGLDFAMKAGDRIGITGPNGTGKTTLFHLIMGLLSPLSGTVEVFGRKRVEEDDFIEVRRRIGFLFQNADDQLFSPTVAEDVAFGPFNLGKKRAEVERIVRETLRTLGIEHLEKRVTHKLSGGEKRLVSLATVLSMQPEALLLDEPTTGLAAETESRISDFLNSSDLSYIVISHDSDFLASVTDRLLSLKDGKITGL